MKNLSKALAAASILAVGLAQSANATPIVFTANMTSAAENNPADTSTATGFSTVILDGNFLSVTETWSGLTSLTTDSHIHCCIAPPGTTSVALPFTGAGFPRVATGNGVLAGTYTHVFDLTLTSTYNAAFVTANGGTTAGAETALINGLLFGQAYTNIHTQNFPGGEIRGLLVGIPEPSTLAIFGASLLGVFGFGMMRRRADA